jgi:hypothetical protein
MLRRALLGLLSLLLFHAPAQTRAPSEEIRVQTKALPPANIGHPYEATIQAIGGTPPLQFLVTRGVLPPGIRLQPSGMLIGTPRAAGNYTFTVSIADATRKTVTASFVIGVEDYLTVRWKDGPRLDTNTLSGSVEVVNNSPDGFDQTVIIVAVNEIGKAFALGYQHFNLAPQTQQAIPYSSSLPNGHYNVHVDAVAEIPARQVIRRARLQTLQPITIDVNR